MMTLENTAGGSSNYVLQIIDRVTGLPPIAGQYLLSDALLATVSTGKDLTTLFNPTCSWNSADTGLVNAGIPTGQTAAYDTTGDYRFLVQATRAGVTEDVIDCLLRIFPAVGYSTTPPGALATYQDVIDAWPGFARLPASRQTSLLKAASRKILSWCRTSGFVEASYSEYHDGHGQNVIWLKQTPVITISQITINSYLLSDVLTNSTGTDWTVKPNGMLVRGPGLVNPRFTWRWPTGTQNILVQYSAGHSEVPSDIVEATVFYCRYLAERIKTTGIFAEEDIGDYTYKLNTAMSSQGLPDHVIDLLANYVQDDGPQ